LLGPPLFAAQVCAEPVDLLKLLGRVADNGIDAGFERETDVRLGLGRADEDDVVSSIPGIQRCAEFEHRADLGAGSEPGQDPADFWIGVGLERVEHLEPGKCVGEFAIAVADHRARVDVERRGVVCQDAVKGHAVDDELVAFAETVLDRFHRRYTSSRLTPWKM
jgi:hypothetical protein